MVQVKRTGSRTVEEGIDKATFQGLRGTGSTVGRSIQKAALLHHTTSLAGGGESHVQHRLLTMDVVISALGCGSLNPPH